VSTTGRRTIASLAYVAELCRGCPRLTTTCRVFQFESKERDGIEAPPASMTKDGVYQCKKHGSTSASMRCSHPCSAYLILDPPQPATSATDGRSRLRACELPRRRRARSSRVPPHVTHPEDCARTVLSQLNAMFCSVDQCTIISCEHANMQHELMTDVRVSSRPPSDCRRSRYLEGRGEQTGCT
jgi:hypothetical protein